MKNMKMKGIFYSLMAMLVVASSAFADATPLNEVKATVDQVVQIVQAFPGQTNTQARREKLRQAIAPRFDFDEMARRSLGSYWNELNPDQQKQFVDVFSKLLAKTYLNRIENVKQGMVKIDSQQVQNDKGIVRTTVNNNGDTFPIDYRVLNEKGDWKVYDVVIENIGLVANYRQEFAGIIRREKFDGLMKRLREKAET